MSSSPRVLIPLPDLDFDTTEAAVAWKAFRDAGCEIVFATENGAVPACDPMLLGSGWKYTLPAGAPAVAAYREMTQSPEFQNPITYRQISASEFDAVHLSGGHSQGMRQYLDSTVLQSKVVDFKKQGKVIGAICHGVLVPARAVDPGTGKSVLDGQQATTLTLPLEKWAFRTTWHRVGRRYRTYWKYTETEVRAAVGERGGIHRGESFAEPFAITSGQFVTGRYPADVPLYAEKFLDLLTSRRADSSSADQQPTTSRKGA